ncbi:MAG TPA: isochorismatase family protein, partial [Chryseolinea sp.]|nr:isochorismatase family protein [Chryseolinea sp.]
FVEAIKKTGRKRLVMAGVLTEVCLAYPVVNALKDDYEVSIVVDASGGSTRETHDIAVLRMIQAGAVPNTTIAMITEWFRDWAGPLAPAARKIVVPLVKETAIVKDIYPRTEIAQAAEQKAADGWAAKKKQPAAI